MSDLVILYSGGSDSYLLLKLALQLNREPYCVLVDMGQKNINELQYAKTQLKKEKVQFQQVAINGLNVSSGLTGDNIAGTYDGVSPMYVPSRNNIFISTAASVAEYLGVQEIWFGANFSDRLNLFPDCTQEYVFAMNRILEISLAKPIKLQAPLLGWTKEMVFRYLKLVFKINPEEIYSGY